MILVYKTVTAKLPHILKKGLTMNYVTSIGLDVHARSIKAAAFNIMTGEINRASFGYDPAKLAEWILCFDKPRAVYESGVTGFDLARKLNALGVECLVGAVSKMQKPSADKRIKTDRKDAEFLARLLATHNIVSVWIPDDECEAARNLSRTLADVRDDLMRAKQRLSKFLLRHGYLFDERNDKGQRKKNWTAAHWRWIQKISFKQRPNQIAFEHYIDCVKRLQADKKALENEIKSTASLPRWEKRVDAIRCLKGIEIITAFALVVEADSFSRFDSASAFSAWIGLVPSEHSSGESQHHGGITKAGNSHLRKLLVESAWHYTNASRYAKQIASGQVVEPAIRRHALKGVRRLIDRRIHLHELGKKPVVANCATARELSGWVWAIGSMAQAI